MACPTAELGMTILHCFTTPVGVGSTVLQSSIITPFAVAEMLTVFFFVSI